MPKAKKPGAGLTDAWGRSNNRKHADRKCKQCGQQFRPRDADHRYCSRPCASANAGKNQVRAPEVWWKTDKGYIEGRVTIDGVTRRTRQHRWVIEKHLGRRLLPHEDVHHINGVRTDNRIENLEVIDHRQHACLTAVGRPRRSGFKLNLTQEQRDKRAATMREMRRRIPNTRNAISGKDRG